MKRTRPTAKPNPAKANADLFIYDAPKRGILPQQRARKADVHGTRKFDAPTAVSYSHHGRARRKHLLVHRNWRYLPSPFEGSVPGIGIGTVTSVAVVLAFFDCALLDQRAERPALKRAIRRPGGL